MLELHNTIKLAEHNLEPCRIMTDCDVEEYMHKQMLIDVMYIDVAEGMEVLGSCDVDHVQEAANTGHLLCQAIVNERVPF